MEIWAGIECTINRVGENYFNQLEKNGHLTRLDDLDRIYDLGICTLRYPCLWEQVAPHDPEQSDWSWLDERLNRLRALGIEPIAGLLHHGSGPAYTNLLDPQFARKFARYAAAFARRYPWIKHYTPINEPLTTARFSGLYGLWYPHARDAKSFLTMLLNQCRGIALAMQAIRAINPEARLIQTEDMGRTWSTPLLSYQAKFENQRRWLSLDLLAGKLTARHPLWKYILAQGISARQLQIFQEKPCPPDLIGINYYVTSERFIDESFEDYPVRAFGGNHRHHYADVEAVRVGAPIGLTPILLETWERYGRPLAVTEAHLHCTREEQMRWLLHIRKEALQAREAGADVRAITPWALFGSHNWNSLLTRDDDHYETGVFDIRSERPRPTALAGLIRGLIEDGGSENPLTGLPGWWQRPEGVVYPKSGRIAGISRKSVLPVPAPGLSGAEPVRPVLITGATGTLGQAFGRICALRGIPYRLLNRQQLDIADPVQVGQVLAELDPWALINTAGYVRVDQAEAEAERCRRENTDGPAVLAAACARRDCRLLTFSSDLVFDGTRSGPYVESVPVSPLNVYGHSKAEAEQLVLDATASALVVRTSAFFGPWDEYNFVTLALRSLRRGERFPAAEDVLISPTYVPDLVHACLDLLIDGESGIWHLANQGALSWADLGRLAAGQAGLDPDLIAGCPSHSLGLAAPRPLYGVLGTERAAVMPALEDALQHYFQVRYPLHLTARNEGMRQVG